MTPISDNFCYLIQKASFLKNVALFNGFSSAYLASLARITTSICLEAGETLFSQGDYAECLYILRTGRIGIEIDGRQVVDLDRFECLGELSVFGEPWRSATAIARTDADLVCVDSYDFKTLLTMHPGMSIELMKTLSHRLKQRESEQYS